MEKKKKFSKDPIVELISIDEFFNETDFLKDVNKNNFNESILKKEPYVRHIKFTEDLFIIVTFYIAYRNFGADPYEKVNKILVVERDGVTEYEGFDRAIKKLEKKKSPLNPKSKSTVVIEKNKKRIEDLESKINNLNEIKDCLPSFKKKDDIKNDNCFEKYIVQTDLKTEIEELKNKYVVFDTETNGLRFTKDDLLSISIFNPDNGECYNRYLPLSQQPLVLTEKIHGISDLDLKEMPHMTQAEVDWLIERFDLKNKTLLSYSGGKGLFDFNFLNNYCKRQKLTGFEDLSYDNIKKKIPATPFGCEGELTKDNLCKLLKIEGTTLTHTSLNDCLLQWKLFERLETEKLFFINNHLFNYSPDYIIPVTHLSPILRKFAGLKNVIYSAEIEEIFSYSLPKNVIKKIKKFPTNITGITIENAINHLLDVKEEDNIKFLIENKKHLEYRGSINSSFEIINVTTNSDGTISTDDEDAIEFIDEVNEVTNVISNNIAELIDFIKNNIFKTEIKSQELVISEDKKVLAICDLSDENAVLEIKTFNIFSNDTIRPQILRQLFYQSKGRDSYVLSFDFVTGYTKGEFLTKDVIIKINKVIVSETEVE